MPSEPALTGLKVIELAGLAPGKSDYSGAHRRLTFSRPVLRTFAVI